MFLCCMFESYSCIVFSHWEMVLYPYVPRTYSRLYNEHHGCPQGLPNSTWYKSQSSTKKHLVAHCNFFVVDAHGFDEFLDGLNNPQHPRFGEAQPRQFSCVASTSLARCPRVTRDGNSRWIPCAAFPLNPCQEGGSI